MEFGFDTESPERGKAALILYTMYRSREPSSPLNGLETWTRFVSFAKGACLKSTSLAEFVDNFCKKAQIGTVKPLYLKTDGNMVVMPDGSIIEDPGVKDYKLNIFAEDGLLPLIEKETQYLVLLVRERIQREKLKGDGNETDSEI